MEENLSILDPSPIYYLPNIHDSAYCRCVVDYFEILEPVNEDRFARQYKITDHMCFHTSPYYVLETKC